MTWYNPLTWFKPEPFQRWPTRTVTYCFREMVQGNRFPYPQEYRNLARECAGEWTDNTVILLVEGDFFDEPQPDIVISSSLMQRNILGFGYFPGKNKRCGDIDISVRNWKKRHTRDFFKTIILHEFGHALGLKHNWRWQSIMFKFPKAKEIHKFDIKNLDEGYADNE